MNMPVPFGLPPQGEVHTELISGQELSFKEKSSITFPFDEGSDCRDRSTGSGT